MIESPDTDSSAVDNFVNDLRIVLDAARAARFPIPIAAAALRGFLGSSAAGYGRADDSQAVRFHEGVDGRPVRRR
jgi:3-hydroxyisobutyrate dehydrogenase